MRLDSIIRAIDNKEFIKIEFDKAGCFKWYDIFLENGDIIKFEYLDMIEEDEYEITYFNDKGNRILNMWKSDFKENSYYIFKNLFNDVKRYYEGVK